MKKIIVTEAVDWTNTNMHPYTLKGTRKANHPIRMIQGGKYLVEDLDLDLKDGGDMGIWGLNAKDYQTFKSLVKTVQIEIDYEII